MIATCQQALFEQSRDGVVVVDENGAALTKSFSTVRPCALALSLASICLPQLVHERDQRFGVRRGGRAG